MSSQGPRRPTISEIHQASLRALTEYLVNYPHEENLKDHRLSHVQALEDRLRPDRSVDSSAEITSALIVRAQKQAHQLRIAENLNLAFAEKQFQVTGFISAIRQQITEPKLTATLVQNAMMTLLKQFDDRAQAVQQAVVLAEKSAAAANDLAKIKAEATASPSLNASSSTSSSASSTSSSSSSSSSSSAPILPSQSEAES